MPYRKCPRCEMNYILNDRDEYCKTCIAEMPTDFSEIVRGRCYGGDSRKIYEKFCKTLGWDPAKATQFGWQTPLRAINADTDRVRDVWFIFYANYNKDHFDSYVQDAHVINYITPDEEKIYEIVDDEIGSAHPADRITFVKTEAGYKFLGVYTIEQNGTLRIYQRISDRYPIQ